MNADVDTGRPEPVFPFTDAQVDEVADALRKAADEDLGDSYEGAARAALRRLATVLQIEHQPGPPGCPRGYGWRAVRGVTAWVTIDPAGRPRPLEGRRDLRDRAVEIVDVRHGFTAEFAPDPDAHRAEYDETERLLYGGDRR
jgi:hypothetical protein